MVGTRSRASRHSQSLSLTAVASKARISAATLSRIETEKQKVDLGLFLSLARILKVAPQDLLGEAESIARPDPLVRQIVSLHATQRVRLWRELAAERRQLRASRRSQLQNVAQQVEELLAQVEFLHEGIDEVRTRIKKRR